MKPIVIKRKKDIENLQILSFNRGFSLRENLVESMRKHGFISRIILAYSNHEYPDADPLLYVIDGQHRLKAAEYLSIPVYADILEGDNYSFKELVDLVATYNNQSVRWSLKDYVSAWHMYGKSDYSVLEGIQKKYGFSHSVLAVLLSGSISSGSGRVTDNVRKGKFKVKAKKETLKTLELVTQLSRPNNRMLTAFHNVRLTSDNFNFTKFKSNYEKEYSSLKNKKLLDYVEYFKKLL